ncbi:MAG: carboxypeptidase-like regulatory domain-containing protein [Burkholderiaceae bacterium]|nr:carboxypeptidase-like regulatory domain-containing protein [Burkholderiaceae bacterium]
MKDSQIEEGELLAYLCGENLPHVEAALRESPELRAELERLRQVDEWLRRLFAGTRPLDPQDVVDVAAGLATPEQRLLVAAWARRDPAVRQELAELEAEAKRLDAALKLRPLCLPQFVALPLTAAMGVRAAPAEEIGERAFYVAELQVQIVLRVAPLGRERWRVEGYLTQHHVPLAGVRVSLHSATAHPRPRTTDEAGLFTFRRLPPGIYTLTAVSDRWRVTTPDIALQDE